MQRIPVHAYTIISRTLPNPNPRWKTPAKIGIEEWVKEQEEGAKRGVVYADIRYRTEN